MREGTRLASIDCLRGLVMALMAIDHVRDFLGEDVPFLGVDVDRLGAPLVLTRFLTHFCAPVFVLLAGTSVGLRVSNGSDATSLRPFLVKRGLFLVVVELTIVRFGWSFDPLFRHFTLGVIWALGVSMVVLAPFVGRSPIFAAIFGLTMIVGHGALDAVHADSLGAFGPLFAILHEPHLYPLGEARRLFVLYPLVPWIGVMTTGYALAFALVGIEREERVRRLATLGLAGVAAFVVLRSFHVHVDPREWTGKATLLHSALSMLDCTKYPPSLGFLLMTLGPALLVLAAFEATQARLEPLLTLGRAPLFYYVVHLYAAHLGAFAIYLVVYGRAALAFALHADERPRFPLLVVYGFSAALVALLVPACRRFAAWKKSRPDLGILAYV